MPPDASKDDLPPALIRAELARVIASSSFRHALQLQRFLKYLVDAVLAQEQRRLREFSLALDCFARSPSSYDPRKDPIVRVAAGRLREKLRHYYTNEGREAYVEISLPVGTYTPVFGKRSDGGRRPTHRSIAVLPFFSAGSMVAMDGFCEQLVAELIDALTKVAGLKVVAQASASRFTDSDEDTRVIGAALGVSTVLRGNVEQRRNRVRVSARLESTRNGALLWSGVFDEVAGAQFVIQNHIAQAVVSALRQSGGEDAPLLAPAGSFFVGRGTTVAEAKNLHDRGRFALRQQGIEGYRKAVTLFEQAIGADRQFASAYSGLALAHLGLVARAAAPAASHVQSAKAALRRALELDPQSSEACASLAVITFRYEFNWKEAEPLYQMAIRLAPGSRYAHQAYAFALTMNGRFGEADTHYRTARDLDPVDYTLRCQHALISIYTARYEDAEAELLAVIDVDGANVLARALLGATYLYWGRPRQALKEFEWAAQAAPQISIGLCGQAQALALLGEEKRAIELLQELLDRYAERFVSPYQIAMVQARLGNDAAAFQWLDRAGAERDANFVCVSVDPTFAAMRERRPWRTLMTRYGLAETVPFHAAASSSPG